ncbi:MAG TPA: ketoacyl-ACP synthase III, partial [Gemmatimonadales bacterium]|nr:ketoacyl-ACP synthase III [Gemmatimonadales bacterium]
MSQSAIGLCGLGAYAPARVMTNDEWSQYVETTDAWITERTGIKRRHLAAPEETTVDLAAHAATAALADAGLAPADIDELVVTSDTPEVYTPDTASFLQVRLGLRNVPAYDLAGSGCAGFILGLDVARARVRDDPSRRILVVGVELISRLMDWSDRNICVLFGDGAGAAVIAQAEGVAEILAATAGTDGRKSDILKLEVGGTRSPVNAERVARRLHQHLEMNGREVFKEAVAHMSAATREVLDKAGLTLDDVALLVPHQANLRILEAVRTELGLPEDRVVINVQEYGNTGSASV